MKTLLKVVIGCVAGFVAIIAAVFYFTAGLTTAADGFFTAVKQRNLTAAYAFLSEDFKASTDPAALEEFLTQGALLDFKEASWSNRQISGGRGELQGEVLTSSGGVVSLRLFFIKESDAWKIYAIQKPTAGLQAAGLESEQTATPGLPSKPEQLALVRRSMHDFGVSLNAKSMAHFHKTLSRAFQRQFSVAQLEAGYAQIASLNADFTRLDAIEPALEPVAQLGASGELILKGQFPTNDARVSFEQHFIYEGIGWKLITFNINVKSAQAADL